MPQDSSGRKHEGALECSKKASRRKWGGSIFTGWGRLGQRGKRQNCGNKPEPFRYKCSSLAGRVRRISKVSLEKTKRKERRERGGKGGEEGDHTVLEHTRHLIKDN